MTEGMAYVPETPDHRRRDARRRRQARRRLLLLIAGIIVVAAVAAVWSIAGGDAGDKSPGGELGLSLGPLLKETVAYKPTTFYKESSGICRYDFLDWGARIKTVSRTTRSDAADLFSEDSKYVSSWRLGDGVNFTLAGQERLADHVLAAIEEDWRPSRAPQ